MEPFIEKWDHPYGTEYCLVFNDKILGSVVPMDKQELNKLRRWRALVNHRIVGVFTGADGRLCAMRAVRHFAKHLWCGGTVHHIVPQCAKFRKGMEKTGKPYSAFDADQ